ncbi:hypothetical protein HA402_000376 [Bradysia odoriphaga]|nr:hypothetical protein HA402_000376 [Bradysia odoriphaga]
MNSFALVADCFCLMSLNHLEAIPVDTHVYQSAKLHYLPELKDAKSVTAKVYNEIGDKFREVYGDLAGWAQTVRLSVLNLMLGLVVNDEWILGTLLFGLGEVQGKRRRWCG